MQYTCISEVKCSRTKARPVVRSDPCSHCFHSPIFFGFNLFSAVVEPKNRIFHALLISGVFFLWILAQLTLLNHEPIWAQEKQHAGLKGHIIKHRHMPSLLFTFSLSLFSLLWISSLLNNFQLFVLVTSLTIPTVNIKVTIMLATLSIYMSITRWWSPPSSPLTPSP